MTLLQGSADLRLLSFVQSRGDGVGVGERIRVRKGGGSEFLGLDLLCIRIYPLQQWGTPNLVLTKTAWEAR